MLRPWVLDMVLNADLPGLVNVYITNWKITIFNGKTHYKWSFSIAMLNYQRVMVIFHGFCGVVFHIVGILIHKMEIG